MAISTQAQADEFFCGNDGDPVKAGEAVACARLSEREYKRKAEIPYAVGRGPNVGRVVLHVDLNNFFASVECFDNPALRAYPVAVCGDPEKRHGIVLAKNEAAKRYGVTTGEAIPFAKQKCPSLVIVPAHYERYMLFSRGVREIYRRYTDRVEPFGMDEAWLELSENRDISTIEDGRRIAEEIRESVFREWGLTVSVGVSDNKVFAKLASDYKKPDAVTVLSPREYDSIIAELPISALLFAGRATTARIGNFGMHTIGQVARSNPLFLKSILGKNGLTLYRNCRGENEDKVAFFGERPPIQTIGNSTTPPRDITDFAFAKQILSSLCDTVGSRMRAENVRCGGLNLHFRDTELHTFERRTRLKQPTSCTRDLLTVAYRLFCESVDIEKNPLRSLGVTAVALSPAPREEQISLFPENGEKRAILDRTVDALRMRYGGEVIRTAFDMCDKEKAAQILRGYEVFTHVR